MLATLRFKMTEMLLCCLCEILYLGDASILDASILDASSLDASYTADLSLLTSSDSRLFSACNAFFSIKA